MKTVTACIRRKAPHLIGDIEAITEIREHFSVPNDAVRFSQSPFVNNRKYVITNSGKFQIGLLENIKKFLVDSNIPVDFKIEDDLENQLKPQIKLKEFVDIKYQLRYYQKDLISACLNQGRGIVYLGTGGGKTLSFCSLVTNIDNYYLNNCFTLIVVPSIQLVKQTYDDFLEYGIDPSIVGTFSGNNKLDLSKRIIISNTSKLISKKTNLDWLKKVNLLIVDEVQSAAVDNKINKIIDKIPSTHKYGFTGTLPENKMDMWNIQGRLGPVIYRKPSSELIKEGFNTNVDVLAIKMGYKNQPILKNIVKLTPSTKYYAEIDFIINNNFRNANIEKICNKFSNNTLVLVDRIEHGEILYDRLKTKLDGKDIYFIQGDVDVDVREDIRKLMEKNSNIVCIAISKIFSTGINIKNLHYIVLASSGKAKSKIIQTIGRGLRKHKSKTKLLIIDIVDKLYYSKQHFEKRIRLYKEESIPLTIREVNEK